MPPRKKAQSAQSDSPTIRDVAKLAKVGVATVSRVLNDYPGVKPKTKKKVFAAIEELGYQRNEAAGLLKGQRAMMIGLIVPDLSDIFFAICANTIERLARDHGYLTLIVSSGHDPELEIQQTELMARRKLSGLLLVTTGKSNPDRIRALISDGLPIVAFDRPLDGVGTDVVLVENRTGAEEAIEHLIAHGHKQIACIGCDDEGYPVKERVKGYRSAMLANGLSLNLAMAVDSADSAMAWLDSVLPGPNKPTAIFSTNYRTSISLLLALAAKKIKIPKDMAVVGFDDFELAPLLATPLTTVGQSPIDLAKRAFRLLQDRIHDASVGVDRSAEKILLPATLIVRESCGNH